MKTCTHCGAELKKKIWHGKRKYTEATKRFGERQFCGKKCNSEHKKITMAGRGNYFYGKHDRPWNYDAEARWKVRQSTGYIRIIFKDKNGKKCFKYEHREVIEGYLKRPIKRSEVIHHINGDRSDNRLENLLLCSQSQHMKLHKKSK